MRRWVLVLTVLAATAETAPCGDDDEFARACAEFDAIVAEVATVWRRPRGPSLTRLVHDFTSHDAAVVRRVEKLAWEGLLRRSGFCGFHAPPVEQVIRFVHGLPPRRDHGLVEYGERSGLETIAGAVVLRSAQGGSHSGSGLWLLTVAFDGLVGEAPIVPRPLPSASALLAVAIPERPSAPGWAEWSDSTTFDFAMALGEACGLDDDAFALLMRRAIADARDPALLLALGWSGRDDAVAFLSHAVATLSTPPEAGSWLWRFEPLEASARALRHADAAAFDRTVRAMPEDHAVGAVGSLGRAALVHHHLAAVDAAVDDASRVAALRRLCEVDELDWTLPAGDDAERCFRALLAWIESGDAALREGALAAVTAWLSPGATRSWGWRGGEAWHEETDTGLGSCAGPEPTLRALVEDSAAGRLSFRERGAGATEAMVEPCGTRAHHAASDVTRPSSYSSVEQESVPIHVTARRTPRGLHVVLRNEGADSLRIDPIGLRYAEASRVTATITPETGKPYDETRLRVAVGRLPGHPAVRASDLIALEPGATHEFDVLLRADLRDARKVDLSIVDDIEVLGASPTRVVRFGWTPVL